MNIIFAGEDFPKYVKKTIFLAGPSPREEAVDDWRNQVVEQLKEKEFDGTIYIPIPRKRFYKNYTEDKSWTYDNQVEWECLARQRADALLFWIPRNTKGKMPGLTTNIEFGEDLRFPNIFYGRPDEAESCRYLDKRIEMQKKEFYNNIDDLINNILKYLGEGSERKDAETEVPLYIWKTPNFSSWYNNLKESGNSLLNFKLKDVVMIGRNKDIVFYFNAHVNIWVEKEKRYKANENIFARTNISSIISYYEDPESLEKTVVLVKEFRSPVSNIEGFVFELPGGSSFDDISYQENAQTEYFEEVGLMIEDKTRFIKVSQRQLAATFGTHISHLYSLKLTKEEFLKLKDISLEEKPLGMHNDEITYVVLAKEKDIYNIPVDYSTIGMIKEALV